MFEQTHNMKIIDVDMWQRKEVFLAFLSFDSSFINFTVEFDVSKAYAFAHEKGVSFFCLTLYILQKSLNSVPQFRQRFISEHQVAEFDNTAAYFPVLLPNKEYQQVLLEPEADFASYHREYLKIKENIANLPPFFSSKDGRRDIFCASCVPWFSFKGVALANGTGKKGGLPVLLWDKMDANGKIRLAMRFDHAFADGYHLGLFVKAAEAAFNAPETM